MARGKRSTQQAKLEDVHVSTKRSRGEEDDETSEPEEPQQKQKEPTSREDLFKRRMASKTGTEEPQKAPSKQQDKKEQPKKEATEKNSHSTSGIWVNRAPVLTLWVAVVAQRQGFSRDAGLTFGKAIAGLLAQSKGKAIGVYEDKEKDEDAKAEQTEKEEEAGVQKVDVFGMKIKGVKAAKGEVHALDKGTTAVKPGTVQSYLSKSFGPRLEDAEAALQQLAESFEPDEIGGEGYRLYERFRPSIPQGQQGWGRKGLLELEKLQELKP